MCLDIKWVAAAASFRIYLYQTISNKDIEIHQIIRSLLSKHSEIRIDKTWTERRICLEWPENNHILRNKILKKLNHAGILIREIHEENQINAGAEIFEKERIPLTKDLFNLLTVHEKDAVRIARQVCELHNGGVIINDEILKLLTQTKTPFQMMSLIEVLHTAFFTLSKGDLLLLSKSLNAMELQLALEFLTISNIPLTHEYFLFLALNENFARKLSNTIRILHQADISLTPQIRQLLKECGENSEIIGIVIKNLHHADISLTEEICNFLINASAQYTERKNSVCRDLLKKEAHIPAHLFLRTTSYADMLTAAISTFHLENSTPIPAKLANYLAENSIYGNFPIFLIFFRRGIPITDEISNLLTLDAEEFMEGLLYVRKAGIHLTNEVFALFTCANQARFSAISKLLVYLDYNGKSLKPEMQEYISETLFLGLSQTIEQLHLANIPLSLEIQELISKTYEARIYAVGREIVNSNLPLKQETIECMSTIASFPLLTEHAIKQLHTAGLSLSREILSYLITVNEMQCRSLVWQSCMHLKKGISLDHTILEKMITNKNYHHFETPGVMLIYLNQAGIPLNQTTFDAMKVDNVSHLLAIQCIVRILGEKGLLTDKNFNDLVAGYGARVPAIFKKIHESSDLDQTAWDQILEEIQESEWKPCAEAAIVLAERNRMLERVGNPGRLPAEIIGKIAGYLAPPGIPSYSYRAEDAAREEELQSL